MFTEEKNVELRLQEIENLDEKRLAAKQLDQARMARSFDKKVRQRAFKKGDVVLAVRRPMILTHKFKGKFEQKWKRPRVNDKVYSNSAYAVLTLESDMCIMRINGKFLKRYYS